MSMNKLPHDKEAAAQLLAYGGVEKQDIAKQLGISRTTLWTWEKNDDDFKARVDELKQEFEGFAKDLIQSKLVDAVNEYWKLINTSENDRVKAEGYKFFIERQLGKVTNKVELTTEINNTSLDEDILNVEYDDLDNIIDHQDNED